MTPRETIPRNKQRRRAGFTLVELLVVIVLIGMISVALFGGLRFGVRVWEVGLYRSDRLAEIEIAHSLVRRLLRQAILLPDAKGNITFEGEQERLRFTAPAPAQFGLGGVYLFELFTERVEQGEDMLVRWQLFRGDDLDDPFDDEKNVRVLLEGMKGLTIGYFGSTDFDEDPGWEESWVENEVLPRLVTIDIAFAREDDRVWPPLQVELKSANDLGME